MTRTESTSSRLAKIAARRIQDPDPEVRALAGCVLTQVAAETAGPKPVRAWGFLKGDGKLHSFVVFDRNDAVMDREDNERIVRVEIRAIPPKPRKSVSGKHIVARKGK